MSFAQSGSVRYSRINSLRKLVRPETNSER